MTNLIYDQRKSEFKKILKVNNLEAVLIFSNNLNAGVNICLNGIQPPLFHYYFINQKTSAYLTVDYLALDLSQRTNEKIYKINGEGGQKFNHFFKSFLKTYSRVALIGDAPFSHFAGLGKKIVCYPNLLESILRYKSADEISQLKKSAAIASQALSEIKSFIKPGVQEIEIERKLKQLMLQEGDGLSFPTAITSGEMIKITTVSFPTKRKLGKNDLVCIDLGAIKNGFRSDCTRFFAIGNYSEMKIFDQFKKLYSQANKLLKPGLSVKEIVSLYTEKLSQLKEIDQSAKVGTYFGHSLGFMMHENLRISRDSQESNFTLKPGFVFTIEPEIITSSFRFRMEDMFVVNKNAVEKIT